MFNSHLETAAEYFTYEAKGAAEFYLDEEACYGTADAEAWLVSRVSHMAEVDPVMFESAKFTRAVRGFINVGNIDL